MARLGLFRKTVFLFVPLAWVGCVTQGQYLQVEKERDQLRSSVKTLEQALEREKANGESLALQLMSARSEHRASSRERSRLQSSIDELAKRKAESEARVTEYRSLVDKFKPLVDAGRVRVRVIEGRVVVILPSDLLFAPGAENLSVEGRVAVAEVSGVLASIPNGRFQVAAHTDHTPVKNTQFPSPWDLTSARSVSVLKTMVESGMSPERLSTAGFGDSRPTAPNAPPEGRALDRRIEISVVPDLSNVSGFEELSRAGA